MRDLHVSLTLEERGTGTPKDKDKVNKREVCECDGRVCDLESIADPSIFNVIRSSSTLVRMFPLQKSGQFSDDPVRIKDTPIHYVNTQTY